MIEAFNYAKPQQSSTSIGGNIAPFQYGPTPAPQPAPVAPVLPKQMSGAFTPQTSPIATIKNAADSSFQKAVGGATQIQQGGGPLGGAVAGLEGALKVGEGISGFVFSPLAPVTDLIGKAIQFAGDKLAETPLIKDYSQTATETDVRVLEALQNLGGMAMGILGAKAGDVKLQDIPPQKISELAQHPDIVAAVKKVADAQAEVPKPPVIQGATQIKPFDYTAPKQDIQTVPKPAEITTEPATRSIPTEAPTPVARVNPDITIKYTENIAQLGDQLLAKFPDMPRAHADTLAQGAITLVKEGGRTPEIALGAIEKQARDTPVQLPEIKTSDVPAVITKDAQANTFTSRVFDRMKAEHPDILTGDLRAEHTNLMIDSQKAVDLLAQDKQTAYEVAMGAKSSPDVTSTAVNIAMTEKALADGNHALAAQLIKNRSLAQTRRGQEIVAEKGSITDNSTSRYVKELVASRLEALGKNYLNDLKEDVNMKGVSNKKGALKKVDAEVAKVEKQIKAKKIDVKTALALLDKLACV